MNLYQERAMQALSQMGQRELEDRRFSKQTRHVMSQAMQAFFDNGGYIIFGYTSLFKFYEDHKELIGYKKNSFNRYVITYQYELLLGIPFGTYCYDDFVGMKLTFTQGAVYTKKRLTEHELQFHLSNGAYCNISKAQKLRERWAKIKEASGKELPTAEEIYECAQKIKGVKTVKPRPKLGTASQKLKEMESKKEGLVAEIEQLEAAKKLFEDDAGQLLEENKKLKAANKTLSAKLKTSQLKVKVLADELRIAEKKLATLSLNVQSSQETGLFKEHTILKEQHDILQQKYLEAQSHTKKLTEANSSLLSEIEHLKNCLENDVEKTRARLEVLSLREQLANIREAKNMNVVNS